MVSNSGGLGTDQGGAAGDGRETGEIGCRMGFIHKRSKQRDGRNG